MRSLLLVVLAYVAMGQDGASEASVSEAQMDLTKKITSCWLMTIREISANQDSLNRVMNYTRDMGVQNRTQVYYKIQMNMIQRCFENITLDVANQILFSLNDTSKKGPTYRQIVEDFTYSEYMSKDLDYNLDEMDTQLLKIIKQLETELSNYKDAKEETAKRIQSQQHIEAIKNWKDALEKQAEERLKNGMKPRTDSDKPPFAYYLISGLILVVLVLGGVWVVKQLSRMDTDQKRKTKKNKKQ